MRVFEGKNRLCVVLFDGGPVSAAVFGWKNGTCVRYKYWSRGPRPSWISKASRNMETLLVDSALPTLASVAVSAENAREKLAKIGIGEKSLVSHANGCSVAVRTEALSETSESAFDSGILCDHVTSLASVELASFLSGTASQDSARLVMHENAAILLVREGGRLSLRRFAMPSMLAELDAALLLHNCPQLVVGGVLEIGGYQVRPREGVTLRDLRVADKEAVCAAILSRAAEHHHSGELALFALPRQHKRNVAARWLPPISLALFFLALAAIPPLLDARADESCERERARLLTAAKEEAQARAGANRAIMERIEKLSIDRNARIDGIHHTQKTLGTFVRIQEARRTARHLRLESISVSGNGGRITLSGSLPASYSDEVGNYIEKLAKARFRQTSDLAIRETDGRIVFAFTMEEQP
jgi:hypothetical protein